ncbi:MAG: D-erythronate dehydrogenase [Bacteroidota bacterium]
MQIIITGGAGFLGQHLAKKLMKSSIHFDELLLIDIIEPLKFTDDNRLVCRALDLTLPEAAMNIVSSQTKILFHLAAIVSGHAEKDFNLGWRVNVDATKNLLEACKNQNSNIRFVFASSCAVFGGNLPDILVDSTALQPQTSYGTQKAICELMVNDYSRKGFVDGISLRLPTITIRPGKPNQAASSFASGIIREPLNGEMANCPVPIDTKVWISSPKTVIDNFIIAAKIPAENLGLWRSINLPGIEISVEDMVKGLQKATNEAIIDKIDFTINLVIQKIVKTWPTKIDNTTALDLGFGVDNNFDDFISQYLQEINNIKE